MSHETSPYRLPVSLGMSWPLWGSLNVLAGAIVLCLTLFGLYRFVLLIEDHLITTLAVGAAEAALADLTKPIGQPEQGASMAPASLGTQRNLQGGDVNSATAGTGIGHHDGDWRQINARGQLYRWVSERRQDGEAEQQAFIPWAWERLANSIRATPGEPGHWAPIWRVENYRGKRALRYLAPAHVHPERGLLSAIELLIPMEHAEALVISQMQNSRAALVTAGLATLALLVAMLWHSMTSLRRQTALARRLSQLAKMDALTALPNRAALEERFEIFTPVPARTDQVLGLVLLDIDHFKDVNETLGHATGDLLLIEISKRLHSSLGAGEYLARHGADEFVILTASAENAQHCAATAVSMMKAASGAYQCAGRTIHLTASTGVAIFPMDGEDFSTLLRHADSALHRAKMLGRNRVELFSKELNQQAQERLQMTSGLRTAINANQMLLHYQPQYDAASCNITGFEALVRWNHPAHGLLQPGRFIPLAESSGAIDQLGEWVLGAALAQHRQWCNAGLFNGRMAVNLSLRQLGNPHLADMVHALLAKHQIPASCLELEVTESMISENPEATASSLGALRKLGVGIAVDDFGTGQSSLASLLKYPISSLKIDRSFIESVPACSDACLIVQAVISLAQNLRLRVIAEGIENEDQMDFLRQEGCHELQGYFMAKPLTPSEATDLLKRERGFRTAEDSAPGRISASTAASTSPQ
jgi:diguanylate cyclase (GGDEF)-like protein